MTTPSSSNPVTTYVAPSSLETLFREAGGVVVEPQRSKPLDIAQPTQCWAILEGKLDIFLLSPSDGAGSSRRTFMMRAEIGDIVFGLNAVEDKSEFNPDQSVYGLRSGFGIELSSDWRIIAVPVPGTRCLQAPIADLLAISASELQACMVNGLEQWVRQICKQLCSREFPKNMERIEVGQKFTYQRSNLVVPAGGVVWVTIDSGRVQVNGVGDAGLVGGQGMPMSSDTWLRCEDDIVVMHAVSTQAAILSGDLTGFLSRLQTRFVARSIISSELAQSSNRDRITKKEEESRKTVKEALTRLNQVIEPNLETESWAEEGDKLRLALVLVGQSCGIDFRPRSKRHDGTSSAHSLEAYVRDAKARHRVVALRGQWWLEDNGPLLGFLEESKSPVALIVGRGNKGYVMHNPVDGTQKVVDSAVAGQLSQMAHTFYRGFGDEPMTVTGLMRFGSFGLVREVALVVFLGLTVGALGLLTPYVTGLLFDTVIPSAQRGPLVQLALILLGAAFATSMFEMARSFTMLRIEGKMDASIQAAVWDRLLRLPVPFFRDYGAGDLALRANGINSIRQHLSGSTVHSILSAVFSVSSFFLLFYYSPKLAWVAAGLVAILVLLTIVFGLIRVRFERSIAEVGGRLASIVLEFLSGISKLRTTGSEARAFGRWADKHAAHESLLMRARNLGNIISTINSVYPLVCTGVLFFAIGYFSKEEKVLSTGEYLAFNSAFGSFMGAMVSFTGVMMSLLSIVPIYERAKPILATTPEASGNIADPGAVTGDIEVSGLSFKYTDDGPTILSNVSFHIRPGEFVAFVGPSGSGKSTLLRTLLGFEKPSAGSIFYDGQDLSSVDVTAIRRQIGVVLQNGQLLSGDIYSNIVGSSALTIEDAREAARNCGLDGDIDRMPMGMHTLIPDGGGTLSGGQRQRLLIARAIVGKPRILCFDEATSALDNRNQSIVTESLQRLKTTRIVIAHRLSTIIEADRIFVLVGGRLVQQGSFKELMAQGGVFGELASRQMI